MTYSHKKKMTYLQPPQTAEQTFINFRQNKHIYLMNIIL